MGPSRRLRLGQVTALILRLEGIKAGTHIRLVLYCDCQAAPAYVSACLEAQAEIVIDDLDMEKLSPLAARSSKLLLRVFENEAREWKMALELGLDLALMAASVAAVPIVVKIGEESYIPVEKKSSAAAESLMQFRKSLRETCSLEDLVKFIALQNALDDASMATIQTTREINEMNDLHLMDVKESLEAKLVRTRRDTKLMNDKSSRLRQEIAELDTNKIDFELPPLEVPEQMDLSKVILGQQSRLASGLMEIFPIEPTEQFHFSICGLQLPSVFAINHFDPVQVGAALGLVAQLVVILARYLDVHLPFPIRPLGSQSYINDPINNIRGSRVFPLWTRGVLLYRVEYGLLLLHKDIEQLLAAKEIAVVDLKQTLANLKNLMLVMSA